MIKKYALGIAAIIAATSCSNGPKDKYTDTATTGVVEISTDESFAPIIAQQAEVFENIYTMAGIIPLNTSEKEAISLLLTDSVRLAITTRMLSAQERQSLEDRKFFPKEIKIATDAIALIVNRENPDTLISIPVLKKILTGKITSWQQINPKSELGALSLVFDNPNSSTVRFSIDSICASEPLAGALYAQNDNPSVIDCRENTWSHRSYRGKLDNPPGNRLIEYTVRPQDTRDGGFQTRTRHSGKQRQTVPGLHSAWRISP